MSSKKGGKRSVGDENSENPENTSQKRRRIDDKNEKKENQTPNIVSKKEETSISRKFNESVTEEQRAKHLNGSIYEDAQMLANHCNRSNVAEKDFVMVSELEARSRHRQEKIEKVCKENEHALRKQNEEFIQNHVVAAIREEIRIVIRHEMEEATRRGIEAAMKKEIKGIVREEVRDAQQLNVTLQFIQLVLFIIIFLFICLKTH